jgi:hypothetical protein
MPTLAVSAGQVDVTTLTGKLIMGYQGWFECPGDPNVSGWMHWKGGSEPTVDMLPDVTELPPSERCNSGMTAANGQPIFLFSSENPDTVDRHFAWMQQYGIDGVALQKFANQILYPDSQARADAVLSNVAAAAERHGRGFFLMYDLSGFQPDNLDELVADWTRLEASGITKNHSYLRHRGKPAIGLWGIGFSKALQPPDAIGRFLTELHAASARFGDVSIIAGVPTGWRLGYGDASSDPKWKAIWPKLDVLSPWTVGRYQDDATADRYAETFLVADMQEAKRIGVDYMPVIFPGFSWLNLMEARHTTKGVVSNQIRRKCGAFYWRQAYNALRLGASMIYTAMFDEMDEGTAMLKLVPDKDGVPPYPTFVTLDADGCKLPSDWYLRLAGRVTASLANGQKLQVTPPKP